MFDVSWRSFLLGEAVFQISDNIGLCTSQCIIIIVVSGQDKPMKKIK